MEGRCTKEELVHETRLACETRMAVELASKKWGTRALLNMLSEFQPKGRKLVELASTRWCKPEDGSRMVEAQTSTSCCRPEGGSRMEVGQASTS